MAARSKDDIEAYLARIRKTIEASQAQKLKVNEELKRRGLPPIEDDEPDDMAYTHTDDLASGRPAMPNFESGDVHGDLENRQKKFSMMMKPFQL